MTGTWGRAWLPLYLARYKALGHAARPSIRRECTLIFAQSLGHAASSRPITRTECTHAVDFYGVGQVPGRVSPKSHQLSYAADFYGVGQVPGRVSPKSHQLSYAVDFYGVGQVPGRVSPESHQLSYLQRAFSYAIRESMLL